jgi:hypothetical protein
LRLKSGETNQEMAKAAHFLPGMRKQLSTFAAVWRTFCPW